MYITMLPIILGGVFNMIFTKTKIYKKLKKPIDNNVVLKDGKRLLGDNKTWIGFVSMILFCAIFQIIFGLIANFCVQLQQSDLYSIYNNTIFYNFIIGCLFGVTYMICELPNSFIKRRVGIDAGKTKKSPIGLFFFIFDQIDSLIGVFLVLFVFSNISIHKFFLYVLIGGLTHVTINLFLYKVKIRRNL